MRPKNRWAMKKFYESKIFWAMAIQAVVSSLMVAQEWYSKGDFSIPGIIGLVIGVLVIVLRVFFTDTPIDNPKMRAVWEVSDTGDWYDAYPARKDSTQDGNA